MDWIGRSSPPPHTCTHARTLSLHLMQDLISSVQVSYLGLSVQSSTVCDCIVQARTLIYHWYQPPFNTTISQMSGSSLSLFCPIIMGCMYISANLTSLLESPYLVSEFIMCKHGHSLSVIILLMVYEPPLLPPPLLPTHAYAHIHTHIHPLPPQDLSDARSGLVQ